MNNVLKPEDFFADRDPNEFIAWARAVTGRTPQKLAFKINRSSIIPTSRASKDVIKAFCNASFDKLSYGQQHDLVYALALVSVTLGANFNICLKRGRKPEAHVHIVHINP